MLEDADRVCYFDEPRFAQSAQDAIASFLGSHPSPYAGVSWGKDSVVVAHLLWRFARHVPLVHLRPTNHNPDCDAVRDAYLAQFLGQTYEETIVDYSTVDRLRLTDHEIDKETDRIWYEAIRQLNQRFDGYILGVRAEESSGRDIRIRKWGLESSVSLLPIGRWRTSHVFAYLAMHNLPVHPAYAMLGGGRWKRDRLRVAEIGDTHGTGSGRFQWEREYYGDFLSRCLAK